MATAASAESVFVATSGATRVSTSVQPMAKDSVITVFGVTECCDKCGKEFPTREAVWTGVQTLCKECVKQ